MGEIIIGIGFIAGLIHGNKVYDDTQSTVGAWIVWGSYIGAAVIIGTAMGVS